MISRFLIVYKQQDFFLTSVPLACCADLRGGGGVGGWGLEPLLENSILLNLRSCKITKNISQTPPPGKFKYPLDLPWKKIPGSAHVLPQEQVVLHLNVYMF